MIRYVFQITYTNNFEELHFQVGNILQMTLQTFGNGCAGLQLPKLEF